MQNRTVVPQTLSISEHVVILFPTNAILAISRGRQQVQSQALLGSL